MSILGNLNNLIDDEPQKGGFKVPKVANLDDEKGLTFKKCVAISSALHPLVAFFIIALSFILMLLGINLFMFKAPQTKTQDIEFVLVDKEQMPINKNTKYRADRNSRAGGKHDPKKKVSMPSKATKKAPNVAASSTQKLIKKVAKQQAHQAAKTKPVVKQTQSPAPKKSNSTKTKDAVSKTFLCSTKCSKD